MPWAEIAAISMIVGVVAAIAAAFVWADDPMVWFAWVLAVGTVVGAPLVGSGRLHPVVLEVVVVAAGILLLAFWLVAVFVDALELAFTFTLILPLLAAVVWLISAAAFPEALGYQVPTPQPPWEPERGGDVCGWVR